MITHRLSPRLFFIVRTGFLFLVNLMLPLFAVYGRPIARIKPNIILIVADDLGYGDIGVYGQKKINTPNIDRLAANGMRFTNFYSGTSVCAPSRATLLTGHHTGHTPIRGNIGVQPEGQWPLPANTATIAEILKKAGYVTGNYGKWGLGFVGSSGDPNLQGFDKFYGYNCQTLAHNYFPDHLWDNRQRVELPNTIQNQEVYSAQLIHDNAIRFINNYKHNPFFLFLSYTLPHAGLQLPKNDSLLNYYKNLFQEQPASVTNQWTGKGYQPQPYPHAAYAAMVTRLDGYVGEVVGLVNKLGIAQNTVIVFASDNGPHIEGGNDPIFFNSSGGLKGLKRDLYEGGIRTPFIVSWPPRIKAGAVSDYTGAFWDLLPTFANMAGTPFPKNIDGLSILPELTGSKQKRHEYLYWEFHEQGGKQAVRMGNWKAVKTNVYDRKQTQIALYDLQDDPSEKNNIAAQHPKIVEKANRIMQQAHTENKDFPFFSQIKN